MSSDNECSFCRELTDLDRLVNGASGAVCVPCIELSLRIARNLPTEEDQNPGGDSCLLCGRSPEQVLAWVCGTGGFLCNHCFEVAGLARAKERRSLFCSFCDHEAKPERQTLQSDHASICSVCVAQCLRVLDNSHSFFGLWSGHRLTPDPRRDRVCAFCEEAQGDAIFYSVAGDISRDVALGSPAICKDCLVLCEVHFLLSLPMEWLESGFSEDAPHHRRLAMLRDFAQLELYLIEKESDQAGNLRSDLVDHMGFITDSDNAAEIRRAACEACLGVGKGILPELLKAMRTKGEKAVGINAAMVTIQIDSDNDEARAIAEDLLSSHRESEMECPWLEDLADSGHAR